MKLQGVSGAVLVVLVSVVPAAGRSRSQSSRPIVTFISPSPDSLCGANVASAVEVARIRRVSSQQTGITNASPLTRTITAADAWNLYREVCAEPPVSVVPFCPLDPGEVVYRLAFSAGGHRIVRVDAMAGGCRFLVPRPRVKSPVYWATSPGFWLLLAKSLRMNVSQLFPQLAR